MRKKEGEGLGVSGAQVVRVRTGYLERERRARERTIWVRGLESGEGDGAGYNVQ